MNEPTKWISHFGTVLAATLILLGPTGGQAQTVAGSIVGTVTDPTGAVVPNTDITVTNIQTNVSRTTKTLSDGEYVVTPVLPGEYRVRASASGFQTEERVDVSLHVNQVVRVDFALQVGAITQVVEVTGGARLVETQTATVGTVVENKTIVDLPLNQREYTQLILLTPGAVPVATGQAADFAVGGIAPSVSGHRSQSNNYTLDGVENNETYFNVFAIAPSIDAIQEFKIQTNITSAEFGRAAGANINVAIKSGTNDFHGSVYEFLRNDALDAANFFDNFAGVEKPPFRLNNFGATLGGPVIKDRTFFFFGYEGFRRRKGSTIISTVPTAAQRAGDLSDGPAIYDPASTAPDPNNPGEFIRDEFPGGVIPSGMINPAAALWMDQFLPLPNLPGTSDNYLNTEPERHDRDQFHIRLDHRLSEKDSIYGRYSQSDIDDISPGAVPATPIVTGIAARNFAFTATRVFSPTTVAEYRAGYNYTRHPWGQPAPPIEGPDFVQQTGISALPANVTLFPFVPTAGISGLFSIDQFAFQVGPNHTYQHIANLTHIRGPHTLKAGMDNRNYRNFSVDTIFTNGDYFFSSESTAHPQASDTGSSLASFLLGYPVSFTRLIPNPIPGGKSNDAVHPGTSSWNFYIQDDWRVTPNLTLNLGIRYEYNQPGVPRDAVIQLGSLDFPSGQILFPTTNPLTGEPGNTRPSIIDPDWNNFAPRVGLAYTINPRTVVRSGFGVFYHSTWFQHSGDLAFNPPYVISQSLSLNSDPAEPSVDLQNISFASPTEGLPELLSCYCVNNRNRTSYTLQWNFGIQREVAQDLMVEINYVGNRSNKLEITYDRNQPLTPGPGAIDPRRPVTTFGGIDWKENSGMSVYHGLQSKVEKRFSKGLSILSHYTWSRAIDITASLYTGAGILDATNLRRNRGLSNMHIKHNFVFGYVYEFPIGPGKDHWVANNAFVRKLSEGWQISGITSFHSGFAVNPVLGFDNANVGGGAKPDLVGNPNTGPKTRERWFDTSAFALPAPFTFGTAGRNIIIGPGAKNWDISISKNSKITEKTTLQFRAEFFNAFNHVNFGNPNANFSSPNFGAIFSAAPERQIQFGLKFIF